MSDRNIISDHLLVRWLERVEGYDLALIRDAMDRAGFEIMDDPQILCFIETHFDVDISKLRRELMNIVAPALMLKAKGINYRGYFIPLTRGVAVTVLDKGMGRYCYRGRT